MKADSKEAYEIYQYLRNCLNKFLKRNETIEADVVNGIECLLADTLDTLIKNRHYTPPPDILQDIIENTNRILDKVER